MQVIAVEKFRLQGDKGTAVKVGEVIDVDAFYGKQLIEHKLAIESGKSIKEYQNKMLAQFADKGMPTQPETPEQRSQGVAAVGAETPEQRSQGTGITKRTPFSERKPR